MSLFRLLTGSAYPEFSASDEKPSGALLMFVLIFLVLVAVTGGWVLALVPVVLLVIWLIKVNDEIN